MPEYRERWHAGPGLEGASEPKPHGQIDYLDDAGRARTVEYHGFIATVIQHEFDHLQGKLYVDRMKDPTQFAFDEEYHTYHLEESQELP